MTNICLDVFGFFCPTILAYIKHWLHCAGAISMAGGSVGGHGARCQQFTQGIGMA